MRKRIHATVLLIAAAVMFVAMATSASATPGQSGVCNRCHSGVNVPVTATLAGTPGATATYTFSSPTADTVAVFDGATKVTAFNATSGQFTVAVGRTYTVWAVAGPDTNTGIGSTTVSPVAPAPADTTAPTTTSNALATYVGSGTITLTATDNVGGSGVAATYYRLDGGAQTAGKTINVSGVGAHSLEFWSVDVAGNAEVHKTVSFTITAPVVVDTTAPTTTSNALATYIGSATITLTPTDNVGGSGVAATYYRLDGGTQTAGKTINVSGVGAHSLEFWSVDVAGNAEVHKTVNFTITAPVVEQPASMVRLAGVTRFETAIAASKRAYPTGLDPAGARTVVIATGRNWPDALGGTSLAGVLDGPVLLVDGATIPDAVLAEIERLGATRVIILGGTNAVGAAVEAALGRTLGATNVERIAGADRYATANAIALRVIALGGAAFDGTCFVATGANFPDALASAPLAAAKGWPLFLADPATGLSSATRAAMSGVNRVIVLGGTGAVSAATEAALKSAYGAAKVSRLAGTDRFSTAAAVAAYGVSSAGLGWDGVAIATGQNFPDALAGGVLQGKNGSVMLLTHGGALSAPARSMLVANKADITELTVFGGTGAISAAVHAQVSGCLK